MALYTTFLQNGSHHYDDHEVTTTTITENRTPPVDDFRTRVLSISAFGFRPHFNLTRNASPHPEFRLVLADGRDLYGEDKELS